MQIFVNGEARTVAAGSGLTELLATLDLGARRFAVEINGQIVPAGQHASRQLVAGDQIEVVQAIGGG